VVCQDAGHCGRRRVRRNLQSSEEDHSDDTATAEDKKLFKDNSLGVSLLTLSTTKISFGLVTKANGNAFDAVCLLNKKWAPTGQKDLVALQGLWKKCVLESASSDPTAWFIEIGLLNARFEAIDPNCAKKEWELKAHVLENLPEGYENIVPLLKNVEHDFEGFEEVITDHWTSTLQGVAKGKDSEMALTAFASKKFKGTCNHCGKQGHKVTDCWKKNGKDGNKGTDAKKKDWSGQPDTRKCYNCDTIGHISRNCPKKKESAQCVEEFVGVVDSFFDDWVTDFPPRGEENEIQWEFVGSARTTDDICDDNSEGTVEFAIVENDKVQIEEPAECSDNDSEDEDDYEPELIAREMVLDQDGFHGLCELCATYDEEDSDSDSDADMPALMSRDFDFNYEEEESDSESDDDVPDERVRRRFKLFEFGFGRRYA
jgi:hypothetical protein